MTSSAAEKAEVDALIAQLSPSNDKEKKFSTNMSSSPDADSSTSGRKRVYIRQNSGSNSSAHSTGSPTDAHKFLLQKNARIYKKNDRKSRQGKGRGLAKKGGAGGHYTWGSLGSEILEDYNEEFDEDDLADLQYNEAKEKYLAESTSSSEKKIQTIKKNRKF